MLISVFGSDISGKKDLNVMKVVSYLNLLKNAHKHKFKNQNVITSAELARF